MTCFYASYFSSIIIFLAHLQYIFSHWLHIAQIHVFFIGGVGVALAIVQVIFIGIYDRGNMIYPLS